MYIKCKLAQIPGRLSIEKESEFAFNTKCTGIAAVRKTPEGNTVIIINSGDWWVVEGTEFYDAVFMKRPDGSDA